ncbi:unnamed protein product [Dovyalis caffra]|uniref:Uncharacterized protein n=1 Tax=Dovyalis caffra TaxID=77055 RepID=A0AAV1S6K8_9ROSI|nr:unnamed protein product [Dovyalis caffra]
MGSSVVTIYLFNLNILTGEAGEQEIVKQEDSEELFSIASTAQEHQMLVPALLKDRSQQSEVRSHYIFGLLDDERETNEEKSLIWEAEHLDRVDEVGVGENNVQNQGAKVEGLKVKGPEFGVVVDSKTDEDEWEYITNISLYVKESQSSNRNGLKRSKKMASSAYVPSRCSIPQNFIEEMTQTDSTLDCDGKEMNIERKVMPDYVDKVSILR